MSLIESDPKEGVAYDELLAIVGPLGVIVTSMQLHNFGDGREYVAPESNSETCSVVGGNGKNTSTLPGI